LIVKIINTMTFTKAILALALLDAAAQAYEQTCAPFHEIYDDGEDLCNTMFGTAFKYTTDEDSAYTMWWFEADNANDATTVARGDTVPTECKLEYFHKSGPPTAESDDFSECHPYKKSSCCHEATVTTHDALNEAYGEGFEWDRCGQMSQACERFFVQEACLYECDVNAGLFRKYNDSQVVADPENTNTWQMEGMPIKASYCDAWYTACYNDFFCGGASGDYFECSKLYSPTRATDDGDDTKVKMPVWAWIAIGLLAVLMVAACIFLGVTVKKEMAGEPLFTKIDEGKTVNPVL